ncbi:hypothetical protein [Bacillus sp. FJAT-27245]|uniref:hypothetical protein n=1 Tax=Bacillus sp. FJAT-27245 TaxID=1684144 RepID=UPI0006A77029|nr:hypothetical protein [Bacillus sp. FJAT-27245]
MFKIKKLILDFGSNIFASIIPIIMLQIIIFPIFARKFDAGIFGELLTMIAVVNIVSAIFGNTLNNTRLIQNTSYVDEKKFGDFNILLIWGNIISFIVIFILGNSLFKLILLDNILICFLAVLMLIKSYLSVSYRLHLNFKMVVYLNLITSVGYLLGILLVFKISKWVLPFLVGELWACIFLLFTTKLLKEPFKLTILFKKTFTKYIFLVFTGLLANLSVYLDRFMIFPILGSESVSIYTTAAFFGKSLGLVVTPIAGVLLSYFSQKGFNMNRKKFTSINILFLGTALIFLILSNQYSYWITGILYPTLIDSAEPYLFLANLAAVIGVAATMATPFVLKYSPSHWPFTIELIYLIVYLILSILLLNSSGLWGICVAAICANSIKVFMLYFAGIRTFTPQVEKAYL